MSMGVAMRTVKIEVRSTHPELAEITGELLKGLAAVLSMQPADTLVWCNDVLIAQFTAPKQND